jgi:hypothetical protein
MLRMAAQVEFRESFQRELYGLCTSPQEANFAAEPVIFRAAPMDRAYQLQAPRLSRPATSKIPTPIKLQTTTSTLIFRVNTARLFTSIIGKIDSTTYNSVIKNPEPDAIFTHRDAPVLPRIGIANSTKYVSA